MGCGCTGNVTSPCRDVVLEITYLENFDGSYITTDSGELIILTVVRVGNTQIAEHDNYITET